MFFYFYITTQNFQHLLFQNYPNPFNPTTSISYQIKERGNVILRIYNSLGREVSVLVNEYKDIGSYEVKFDAVNIPSGIYIYRIETVSYDRIIFSESSE